MRNADCGVEFWIVDRGLGNVDSGFRNWGLRNGISEASKLRFEVNEQFRNPRFALGNA
jgi:hypothetical protein